jgi:hypothetical protein
MTDMDKYIQWAIKQENKKIAILKEDRHQLKLMQQEEDKEIVIASPVIEVFQEKDLEQIIKEKKRKGQ